ncbi:MAG TPA: hypothetical protein VIX17_05035 [Pyrinomonadaceae bacterium]
MSGPNLDQAMYMVRIYAKLNENEMGFSWLERGLSAGTIGIFIKTSQGGIQSAATRASPIC